MDNALLKEDLKKLLKGENLSFSAAARALGISAGALSQWMAGKYPGNVEKIDSEVKNFIEERLKVKSFQRRRRKSVPIRGIEFIPTSVSKRIYEIARICHLDGEIGLCYGDAGVGKTVAIKEYVKDHSDVIFIETDLGYTAKDLLSEISKRLELEEKGTIHFMFENIISKVKDSGRLILIDEAEYLPYRALELVRRIYDKANIGILLVGMERLKTNVTGNSGQYAQLYSRVGVSSKVFGLDEEDVKKFVTNAIPDATPNLPDNWVECNGQSITDPQSVYDGQNLPDLNGDGRFLRGSPLSGTEQEGTGIYDKITNAENVNIINSDGVIETSTTERGSINLDFLSTTAQRVRPLNMSVLWIMRIK